MRLTLLTLALLLTACTPTNAPSELVALGNVRNTATAEAEATQVAAAPVTQSYLEAEYAKSLTATALPPQQTATQQALQLADIAITQAWDNLTLTAVAQTVAYSQTQIALVKIDSDAQARIADNNRAMAESQYRADAMQMVYYGGAGIILFGLVVVVLLLLWHGQHMLVTVVQTHRDASWDKVELDREVKAREFGLAITSSGFTTTRALASPIVEQRATRYSHEQAWRTACKKLVEHGVIAGQGGAKHPFSETTLSPFVSRPDTDSIWVDGYRKISRVLQANEIWIISGPRIAPEWGQGWTWDRFSREFDLTPLLLLPDGNPPDVKTPAWSFIESP